MDKQTFCSSQTTSNTSRYAAALYRQGTSAGHPGLLWHMEANGGGKWGTGWDGERPDLVWCPSPPANARHLQGQAACANNSCKWTRVDYLEGLLISHCLFW